MAEQAALKNSIHMKLTESGEYDRCDAPARCRARRRMRSVAPVRRMKEQSRQRLIDSGWRDQLKEYTMGAPPPRMSTLPHCPLRHFFRLHPPMRKLTTRAHADLIRNKGDAHLTVEQLTKEITPQGRGALPPRPPRPPIHAQPAILRAASRACMLVMASATVPDDIKMELLANIRKFVEEQA